VQGRDWSLRIWKRQSRISSFPPKLKIRESPLYSLLDPLLRAPLILSSRSEELLCKCEALSSNLSPPPRKKQSEKLLKNGFHLPFQKSRSREIVIGLKSQRQQVPELGEVLPDPHSPGLSTVALSSLGL
jgi:hypothetical protein